MLSTLTACLFVQDGRTALHVAAFQGYTSTVMALLVNVAEVDAKDNSVRTSRSPYLSPS